MSSYKSKFTGNEIDAILTEVGEGRAVVHFGNIAGDIKDQENLNQALNEKLDKPSQTGSTTKPVYITENGTFAECSDYPITTNSVAIGNNNAVSSDAVARAILNKQDKLTGKGDVNTPVYFSDRGTVETCNPIPRISNNLTSDSETSALSALMGKELKGQIDGIAARGLLLGLWDLSKGQPLTKYFTAPYTYKTGDYYIIGKEGIPGYKPATSYEEGVPSTVLDTENPKVNDIYFFVDNEDPLKRKWVLQYSAGSKGISFSNITGYPTDNENLRPEIANTRFDGQWVGKSAVLSTSTEIGTYNIDLSDYLPNDNYQYEVLFNIKGFVNLSSGSSYVYFYSPQIATPTSLGYNILDLFSDAKSSTNRFSFPVGTDRKVILEISTNAMTENILTALAYRRIGTNE